MPVLQLVVGPNGAGKTTFFERVLSPATHLPFINADVLARQHWPGDEEAHGHDAAALAARLRQQALAQGLSFIAETVFSHPSKLDLLRDARQAGYVVHLHAILVPEDLSVVRVSLRTSQGGHSVPEAKIREQYRRLWPQVSTAMSIVQAARVYDNSSARRPYRLVATYEQGRLIGAADYPAWSAWTGPPPPSA
ncbi:MAG TPA: zeta toxin family protein [Ideonella sp.]|nr:zeta toxin family protein [Ideonella sp.]